MAMLRPSLLSRASPLNKPKILGIVNITPDSFSDGGLYLEADKAIAHGRALLAEGADIVDLGPASSHPDAAKVSAAEEHQRLAPVLEALQAEGAPISVDSFLSQTQLFALERRADYLNDVSGFMDAAIYPDLAAAEAKLIIMHSVQSAKTGSGQAVRQPPPDDIFSHILAFFDQRLEALVKAGISASRFILDPGMGFFLGNQAKASLEVLARLSELKARYDLPLLISVSRKSFLRAVTSRSIEEIQPAVLAAELYASLAGVDYIRTHAPRPLIDGLTLYAALAEHG